MEIPSELKPDLHKALLGPVSLAEEIFCPVAYFFFCFRSKGIWLRKPSLIHYSDTRPRSPAGSCSLFRGEDNLGRTTVEQRDFSAP
jgi:hypothetical protein